MLARSRTRSVPCDPTTKTIATAQTRTTIVRSAVARFEGVCRIPAFARTAVSPANTAAPHAYSNHMPRPPFRRRSYAADGIARAGPAGGGVTCCRTVLGQRPMDEGPVSETGPTPVKCGAAAARSPAGATASSRSGSTRSRGASQPLCPRGGAHSGSRGPLRP